MKLNKGKDIIINYVELGVDKYTNVRYELTEQFLIIFIGEKSVYYLLSNVIKFSIE